MRTSFQFASSTWGRHAGNNTPRPWSDFPLFLLTQLTLVILFYTKIKKFPHPLKKIEYFFPITTHSIVTIYYKNRIVAMEPVFVFTTGNQCRELHIAFQPQG
jgi:hypothetical protein